MAELGISGVGAPVLLSWRSIKRLIWWQQKHTLYCSLIYFYEQLDIRGLRFITHKRHMI
jgi:hypothetical protein